MNNQHFYAVIMAGGGGTRLWPLSRQSKPKQMLKLTGERTLFQVAVDRLEGLFPPDHILVVTVAEQADELRRQCPNLLEENFLLEPMPRGTASVVGLASIVLQKSDPLATMAILTADHYIENEVEFRRILQAGYHLAQENYLVTLGIKPLFPATGYGYIQRSDLIGDYFGFPAYHVIRFKEKPDEILASQFIEKGDHDWNSGMFIWRVECILEEMQSQMPDLTETILKIKDAWGSQLQSEVINNLWPKIKPQTIDYGIMERAERVAVIPAADLGWNDVGSWDSLFDVLKGDAQGNIIIDAQHLGLDTSASLICSDDNRRMVVTIGVQDLIIIDTKDALLVCDRKETQKVRDLVTRLKQLGLEKYL